MRADRQPGPVLNRLRGRPRGQGSVLHAFGWAGAGESVAVQIPRVAIRGGMARLLLLKEVYGVEQRLGGLGF